MAVTQSSTPDSSSSAPTSSVHPDTKSVSCRHRSNTHSIGKHLNGRQRCIVAVTFFSMFFGAGNLIFPTLIGALSGNHSIPALIGFIISAVGLPVLGVIVVAHAGGFEHLSARVSKHFALFLGIAIMLTIGPLFAIPRTASTSFEMALTPFIPSHMTVWVQAGYSFIFFALAFIVSQYPDKLSQILGRFMGPLLLIMILVLLGACIFLPHPAFTQPVGAYQHSQLLQGFLDGYQTMDLIAGLYFGIVISANITALGVSSSSQNRKETGLAGAVTGCMLIIVYGALGFIGAVSQTLRPVNPANANGATVLTNLTDQAFGPVGTIFIGLIFIVACFNVCSGLISTCSSYFHKTFPHIGGYHVPYRVWSLLFTIISFAIANVGLNMIITLAVPVLEFLYPIAIVLVVLSLLDRVFSNHFPRIYLWTVLCTALVSALASIAKLATIFGLNITWMNDVCEALPLHQYGMEWLVPAFIGALIGIIASIIRPKAKNNQ